MDYKKMGEHYQFKRQMFLDSQKYLAEDPNAITCCWCGNKFTMGQGGEEYPFGPQTHCESREHKICPICSNEIKIEFTTGVGFFNNKLQELLVKGISEADYETKKTIAEELSEIDMHLKRILDVIK